MSIDLQTLSVHYGNRCVLRDVNLQAKAGRVMGVVGPNGSGKSTLLKAVAGLAGSSGSIRFHGNVVRPLSLGYMPQDLQVPAALTVLEVVLLGRIRQLQLRVTADDLDAVRQVLQLLDIENLVGRYVSELSGGQRQMTFLAQALVSEPTVLLLDEPISALDICHQLAVLEAVRNMTQKHALTTLIVLHDLNAAARYCDDVALLQSGNVLASGSPVEVLTVAQIAIAFGVESELLTCADGTGVLIPRRALPARAFAS